MQRTAKVRPHPQVHGSRRIAQMTFAAFTINPVDGRAFITDGSGSGTGVKTRLRIFVEDRGSLCAAGPVRQDATIFFIDALSGDATIKPGTFTQMNNSVPGQVDTGVSKLNGSCGAAGQDYGASAATVVLTQVTSTSVAGTFDLTFPGDAGTLSGTFNVPICGQAFNAACQP